MKLIGFIDGVEIAFDYIHPNKFEGVLPNNLKGYYTVELRVTDDAGNVSGMSDMVVAIDFKNLKVKILENNFSMQKEENTFKSYELISKYSFNVLK